MLETVGSVFESYEVQSVHRYIPTDTVKLSTKLYNVKKNVHRNNYSLCIIK